jgi:hypothetical protein
MFVGWIPGTIVAIVAGIVVALVTWNWWLFLPIAFGGAILGFLAMIVAEVVYLGADVRWLRLGKTTSPSFMIVLLTGPTVALLIAFLVLSLA